MDVLLQLQLECVRFRVSEREVLVVRPAESIVQLHQVFRPLVVNECGDVPWL